MVELNGNFYAIEQIESITKSKSGGEYPYQLYINLKSGARYGVSYKDERKRDLEITRITIQIDREEQGRYELIINRLYWLMETVKRLDKRQLRIQKLLKLQENSQGMEGCE